MVITHSSIVPPDYASTAEATAALLSQVGVTPLDPKSPDEPQDTALNTDQKWPPRGALSVRADMAGLHVRGFRGEGPHDHFDHLHLIGTVLASWVVPRWYTPGGEGP